MIVGQPQAPSTNNLNTPTLGAMLDEQHSIVMECLSIADQIDAALMGPKPVPTEGPATAPPSLNQRVESHTQRLAALREKLLAIGQRL